jgi:hypothetical protein
MSLFFLLFISLSALISLVSSLFGGSLTAIIALFSLAVSFGISFFLTRDEGLKSVRSWNFFGEPYRKIGFILLFIPLSFQFTYLLYEIRLDEIWLATINPNNRGDLPMHINMIKAFARGLPFWPDHLFLIGERMRYPFAMNLFNAQFEILGLPLSVHLMVTGLLCLALLISELYQWLGVWGLICFFFSGGLGAYGPGEELAFKNLYLSVFVTQRGFLWALPAGIWLIRNFERKNYIWIFIFSVMPFFHLHSFVFLFIYFCGLHLIRNGLSISRPLIASGFFASPWVLQALWGNHGEQVLHMSDYWLSFRNFGIWGVLLMAAIFFAIKRKDLERSNLWALFLSGLFSVLILAPWDWDQIKILLWCYLLLSAFIFEKLIKKLSFEIKGLVIVLVFYPGLMQIWNSLPRHQFATDRVLLAKKSEIRQVREKLTLINPQETVLAAPIYNHPIFFAGQSVVVGYPGHIWSQAAQSKPALDFIEAAALQGKLPQSEFANKSIYWILSSPFEKEKWPGSSLFSSPDWSLSCVKPGHCQ